MKIQLLHDIAQEFSIEWDSKALEQKLYTPSPLDQVSLPIYHCYKIICTGERIKWKYRDLAHNIKLMYSRYTSPQIVISAPAFGDLTFEKRC